MRVGNPGKVPWFEIGVAAALALVGWGAVLVYQAYERVPATDEGREGLSEFQAEYTIALLNPAQWVRFHAGLTELQKEYAALAGLLNTNLAQMNRQLALFHTNHDPNGLAQLQKQSHQLADTLGKKEQQSQQRPASDLNGTAAEATPEVATLLAQVQNDLFVLADRAWKNATGYVGAVDFFIANRDNPNAEKRRAIREQQRQRASIHLTEIAHQAKLRSDLILSGSRHVRGWKPPDFPSFLLGIQVALLGLSLAALAILHRRRVAQARLVIQETAQESGRKQAALDKMAHFERLAQELAHEVKQPLTAMNARAYTLQKILPPGTDGHNDANVIRSEIKRLDLIVKDFLRLARPAEPQIVPVNAAAALGEIRDLMAPQLRGQGTELKFECPQELHCQADAAQLKQILINLVTNAAESLGHNGAITLRAKADRRELRGQAAEAAVIEVEDTGPGIPPEVQGRIFEPFFSTKEEGSGLGLAIAARIVDRHGGKLEFDTHKGKGTVFRLVLPAGNNGQHPCTKS